MGTTTQLDRDLYTVLLYRNDATELLLEGASNGIRLPAVSVPAHLRVAQEITTAIKGGWNLEACCLFPFLSDDPSHPPIRCQVLEACRAGARAPAGMQWLPVASLSVDAFEDGADFAVVRNSLAMLGQVPGVFARPGWLKTVTEWVETHAAKTGLRLTGEFQQFNASPTFSLIRFETDGPALWFKAVGEPNLREYPITLELASVFPDFLPRMVGSQPRWNAWLALESEGRSLDANSTCTDWAAAANDLALLQISSFGRRFALIRAGCRDLRPCALVNLVGPFLDAMTELMERQTKLSPAPLSRQELVALGADILSALEELGDCAIPSTLGHLDMNPGNVLVCGTRSVFLDWAEAYVGPPFFTLQYLLEHLRRMNGAHSKQEQSVVGSYARHWTRFASPLRISTAFRLMPLLAAFADAAGSSSWRGLEGIRLETAAYLRSLTRRIHREAAALSFCRRRESRLLWSGKSSA